MTSPDTPASLAKHFPHIAALTRQLISVRKDLASATRREEVLLAQLLDTITMASGATASADALKYLTERPLANASAPKASPPLSYYCTCARLRAGQPHHADCDYWNWAASGSGATAEATCIPAVVLTPPKRVSADACTCPPNFCLKGWRGEPYCSGRNGPAYDGSGATGGLLKASGGGSGATDTDKSPGLINITPGHLPDEPAQLKKERDAAYQAALQGTVINNKKGSGQ